MQNPNRFIRGLSDISDIVDSPCIEGSEVILQNPSTPVVVPSATPAPTSSGASSLIQFEQTLTTDGAQILSVGDTIGTSSMLFVNGFIQHKSSYTVNTSSLTLHEELNLVTGDTIIFVYLK